MADKTRGPQVKLGDDRPAMQRELQVESGELRMRRGGLPDKGTNSDAAGGIVYPQDATGQSGKRF